MYDVKAALYNINWNSERKTRNTSFKKPGRRNVLHFFKMFSSISLKIDNVIVSLCEIGIPSHNVNPSFKALFVCIV